MGKFGGIAAAITAGIILLLILFIGGAFVISGIRALIRNLHERLRETRQHWAAGHFIRMIRRGRGEGGER